ncbi:MAG: HEAT repeat domain-containing protein [Anaerolineae bacterium]|nr:HEAT repeat domain-containing protein [Anaerolineae bacterium]
MAHVFICYKHDDSDFAFILRQHLENAGFQVWMDEDLEAGADWRVEIDLAIETAFALIVIMTPESKQSEYVTYEWAHAIGAGKPVIPIMRRETDLHPRLDAFQYLKFLGHDYRVWPWDQLIETLRKAEANSAMYNVPKDAPIAVKRAVAALDSHRREERLEALASLEQIDHPSALDALAAACQHAIRDVRVNAGIRLGVRTDCQDVRAIPGLLDAGCYKDNRDERLPDWAREYLINRFDNTSLAVSFLITGLRHEHEYARRKSAELLGKIGDTSAVPSLLEILQNVSENDELRRESAELLGKIGDASAVPALLEIFQNVDENDELRQTAGIALGKIGDTSAVSVLLEIFQNTNEDDELHRVAAIALGNLGDPTCVPDLIKIFRNTNKGNKWRSAATAALGNIGDPDAVPGLIEVMNNERIQWEFGNIIAEALEKIGTPEALDAAEKWQQKPSYVLIPTQMPPP